MNLHPEINAYELCKKIIEKDWKSEKLISPASVAAEMIEWFEKGDPTVAYHCFLNFKGIARSFLRRLFKDSEERIEQEQLFGDLLQARYPADRDGDVVYGRPSDLSENELMQNVKRLQKEGRAKQDHAIALLGYINQQRLKKRA